MLNVGYVYDLPFFKKPGITHTLLGGWEWSGIVAFSTGTPLNITNGTTYGDNAGVGNGVGTGSYPDLIGNPRANVPPRSEVTGDNYAGFFYNPNAFVAPTGLTFGNVGRNFLRNPSRTNFDMALFKHFAIKESMAFEFRAEAFNVFNHTEWGGPVRVDNSRRLRRVPLEAQSVWILGSPGTHTAARSEVHLLTSRRQLQIKARPRKRPGFFHWRAMPCGDSRFRHGGAKQTEIQLRS